MSTPHRDEGRANELAGWLGSIAVHANYGGAHFAADVMRDAAALLVKLCRRNPSAKRRRKRPSKRPHRP
jgi:hypothetical protein